MQRVPLTQEGYDKMKAELEDLLKVQRPKNIQAISEARAHGDLSENAEYHAAKDKQSFMEGRIQELQDKIGRADIIDISKISNKNRIAFGATVTLMDLDTDNEVTYQLVGAEEADVKKGRISLISPVGKALIGKEVGDEARIIAPGRDIEYEILEITY
jgi:transcription elongation factor GreA